MTIVQTMTRHEALTERDELLQTITTALGTEDRDELRGMSLRGELTPEDSSRVDRVRALDYLLQE